MIENIDHNLDNKVYNEFFAKCLLEKVLTKEYAAATIKDKPDIQLQTHDFSVGVEVTSLKDSYLGVFHRFRKVCKDKNWTMDEIKKRLPKLLKGRVRLNKWGKLIYLSTANQKFIHQELLCLKKTLEIKLAKLQSYQQFQHNHLFIYATTLSDCKVEGIKRIMQSIKSTKYRYLYDDIILYTGETLQIYSYQKEKPVFIIGVTPEQVEYCHERAIYVQKLYEEKIKARETRKQLQQNTILHTLEKKETQNRQTSKKSFENTHTKKLTEDMKHNTKEQNLSSSPDMLP